MSACITYLASPRSRKRGDTLRFDMLRASLQSVRACLPEKLPVIIFHEDYTAEDQDRLSEAYQGHCACEFVKIDFEVPDADFVRHRVDKGYATMCRFWSGIVQRHPAIQRFSHYMRLDDDSFFTSPKMTSANFDRMLRADYSYRMMFADPSPEHEALWTFTKGFLKREGLFMPAVDLLVQGRYAGQAVYNNFHVASLRLWRHPLVAKYVDDIEAVGGCLRRGWLDANIHAMIVCNLLPHTDLILNRETLFGYRHNHHVAVTGSTSLRLDEKIPFVVEPREYA